jgi:predicted O-linked N-acetylglucosamine transferase (SPINDLY family)
MEVAEAEAHYSEKLIRLRGLTFVFQKTPVPAAVRGREAFGLAATKRLYGCPQAIYKCHPDFDQALAAILRRDPEGQIVLIRWTYSQVDQQLRERFRRTMPEVADRIIFLDRLREPEFMNLLTLFDVMIDPFPYGGGNTSLEAFSVGLPVVTFPTQFLRGRITAAFCRKLGLDSCIASSIEEYVEMAVRLAMDPSARREVSAQIMARQQLLFDDQSVVDDWEHFFREIGSAGAAPPHVDRPGC